MSTILGNPCHVEETITEQVDSEVEMFHFKEYLDRYKVVDDNPLALHAGKRIRAWREHHGFSRDEAAKIWSVSPSTVSRWEHQENMNPHRLRGILRFLWAAKKGFTFDR